MSVTIKDVARVSGVSITTVSRVINRTGYVKESTRQRVQDAVQALGYSPNHMARSLSSGSTRIIGSVFPDISNPFFPAVARGIDDALTARGYMLIICNTDNDARQEEALVSVLLEKRVDGIVFVTGSPESGALVRRALREVPVSLIDREVEGVECDTVTCDNYGGAYQVTRHLVEMGHRRIAFISGPPALSTSKQRLAGFSDCLRDAGLAGPPVVYYGDFKYETGHSIAREILSSGLGTTAVFAANDLMALGAERCFTDSGVLVPARMAVAGFDDIFMASLSRPSLTTVAQPAYRMGAVAAEMLLERLGGSGQSGSRESWDRRRPRLEVLETALVVRESTGGGRSPS
jgi:LacI family transcriptional regulator